MFDDATCRDRVVPYPFAYPSVCLSGLAHDFSPGTSITLISIGSA